MPYLLFVAVVAGIVEGVTEFIPVSTTDHSILVSDWWCPPGVLGGILLAWYLL